MVTKKGSIATLLVVAVLALGVMAFIGLENSATGAASSGKPTFAQEYPTQTNGDGIRLSCHLFAYEHPGQATSQIKKICATYGVAV